MRQRRIWITGLGLVTPVGTGVDAFRAGLRRATSPVKRIDRFDPTPFRSQVAAQVDDFDPLAWMPPKTARQLDRFSQFGMVAGRLALEDAAFQPGQDGAADPVLKAAGQTFPIFQWHDDTFTLPEGAVRLAGNGVARNQAFRVGRAAYGTQFHFEADRRLVEEWNTAFAEYLAERQPDWPGRHEGEAAKHGPAADAAGLAMARAWVALI